MAAGHIEIFQAPLCQEKGLLSLTEIRHAFVPLCHVEPNYRHVQIIGNPLRLYLPGLGHRGNGSPAFLHGPAGRLGIIQRWLRRLPALRDGENRSG